MNIIKKIKLLHAKRGSDKSMAEYDLYLKKLLKMVRSRGILVQTMKKGTSFISVERNEFKKHLGAVSCKNLLGNTTHVYLVYEDFDGSIKYYDYPQYSRKDIKKMRKEYEQGNHTN